MIHNVSIDEARKTLSDLVLEAKNGNEVFLTQDNTPIVKLVPVAPAAPRLKADRKPGSAIGEVLFIADDFDAPLFNANGVVA